MSLDPSSFASRDAAMVEASNLVDASATSTADLTGVAGTTGEFGVGALAPTTTSTTQELPLGGTLTNLTEGVAPTPTASTLDLGTTAQSTTQSSTGSTRDPVQESQGQETIPGTGEAQIRIVIQRPGGEE